MNSLPSLYALQMDAAHQVSTNETEKEIRPTAHSQMEIKKILLVLLLIIISQSHTNFEQNLFSRL